MAVRPRNGSWQADVKLGEIRYRETFKTEAEAEEWEKKAKAAYALGQPIPRPGKGQVKNAKVQTITDLVEHCRKFHWKSKKSGDSLAYNAALFADWVGPKQLVSEALTVDQIHAYVEYRQDEKHNSSGTINRHLSAIAVLARYALDLELIPKQLEMPWQDEGVGRLRFFSHAEEKVILALCTHWGLEDYADLFAFLADTGYRLGEAEAFSGRTSGAARSPSKGT